MTEPSPANSEPGFVDDLRAALPPWTHWSYPLGSWAARWTTSNGIWCVSWTFLKANLAITGPDRTAMASVPRARVLPVLAALGALDFTAPNGDT